MHETKECARAKINLSIDVLGVRPDGYHEVEMVMQSVDLCDELQLKRRDDLQITLHCSPSVDCSMEDNLVMRAARLLQNAYDVPFGAELTLFKRIPEKAGLGGGSSDAAAALRGLTRVWGLHLSLDVLEELAAGLGSDVPFCVRGKTAFAYGRGERIRQLAHPGEHLVLLVKPALGLSTPRVYREFDAVPGAPRYASRALEKALALSGGAGLDLKTLGRLMHNDLQEASCRLEPLIADILDRLKEHGIIAMMSGSGPTVMGFFFSEKEADSMRADFQALGYDCYLVRTMA